MIAIVDYDVGNIAAVENMLARLGVRSEITSREDAILNAEKIILPGNGAFDSCMKNLRASGLLPALERKVLVDGVPLLGICVGAQMLGSESEEGNEPGLGWISMDVKKIPREEGLKVPNMGWRHVEKPVGLASAHPLLRDLDDAARFYFVHSYYMKPYEDTGTLLLSSHGVKLAAAVFKNNIFGVQFHPEKSHRFGKALMKNFAEYKS